MCYILAVDPFSTLQLKLSSQQTNAKKYNLIAHSLKLSKGPVIWCTKSVIWWQVGLKYENIDQS